MSSISFSLCPVDLAASQHSHLYRSCLYLDNFAGTPSQQCGRASITLCPAWSVRWCQSSYIAGADIFPTNTVSSSSSALYDIAFLGCPRFLSCLDGSFIYHRSFLQFMVIVAWSFVFLWKNVSAARQLSMWLVCVQLVNFPFDLLTAAIGDTTVLLLSGAHHISNSIMFPLSVVTSMYPFPFIWHAVVFPIPATGIGWHVVKSLKIFLNVISPLFEPLSISFCFSTDDPELLTSTTISSCV